MLDELRNQIIALACVRHGLNPWHGRDVDRLPTDERKALLHCRSSEVTTAALEDSKHMLIQLFLTEIAQHDTSRAEQLQQPLTTLAAT